MFYRHQIKVINGEEILFLYLDERFIHTREFARGKKNQQHLLKRAENYLKKYNLDFNDFKVLLVVNGMVIASLLGSNVQPTTIETEYTYLTSILSPAAETNIPIDLNEQKGQTNQVVTDKNENKKTENTTKAPTKSTASKSTAKTNDTKTNNKTTTTTTTTTNDKQTTTTTTTTTNQEMMVTVYRTNGSNVKLILTDYLIGVVGAEMPASFHEEALRAQALVARTYALKLIKDGRKITDSVSTQAYKDNNQLKTLWGSSYNTYYNKIKKAVESTNNEVIMYNNAYIDAVYHSTSNGRTADAVDVWGNNVPYLKSVDSKWDKTASSYLRTEEKSFSVISLLLGLDFNAESTATVVSRTSNNSVKSLTIDAKTFSGIEIRTILGLRSTDFEFAFTETGISIITRGYGHGVGMSQYGANGMAKDGYKYDKIIKHYYTGVTIKKV